MLSAAINKPIMSPSAATNPGILYHLTDYAVLRVVGTRAQQFLQGQLTQDMNSLQPGAWALAAVCNLQGRVLANFAVYHPQVGEYQLLLPADVQPILRSAWAKYLPFFKVELLASDSRVYGYLGEQPRLRSHIELLTGFGLGLGIDAGAQTEDGASAWQQWRLSRAWHFVNASTSGKYTAHALGLETLNYLSFTKGCYLGQEIIARMHYRGKVKQRIYPLRCSGRLVSAGQQQISTADAKPAGQLVELLITAEHSLLLAIVPVATHSEANHFFFADLPLELITHSPSL